MKVLPLTYTAVDSVPNEFVNAANVLNQSRVMNLVHFLTTKGVCQCSELVKLNQSIGMILVYFLTKGVCRCSQCVKSVELFDFGPFPYQRIRQYSG